VDGDKAVLGLDIGEEALVALHEPSGHERRGELHRVLGVHVVAGSGCAICLQAQPDARVP
jgi:hypothetical protein